MKWNAPCERCCPKMDLLGFNWLHPRDASLPKEWFSCPLARCILLLRVGPVLHWSQEVPWFDTTWMLSHREFVWAPGHSKTKTSTYAILRTVANTHGYLQHGRTTPAQESPHMFRLLYAQGCLLGTRDIQPMTDQPVQGLIYNFTMLYTRRCYLICNLSSCRCSASYSVVAHCKM